jgi:DNA ligase-1
MLFARVAETSRQVAATSSRLRKVDLLAELLKALTADEVETVVAFLSGVSAAGGIGYAAVRDSGATPATDPTLGISDVRNALEAAGSERGPGSELRKREALRSLFARATAEEQTFIQGLLLGELRQGALAGVMLDALAKATGISLDRIRRASMLAGNTPLVARRLFESGEAGLAAWTITLFRPISPMLAQPGTLDQIPQAALEYKLDGARIQVHRKGDEVRVYTRALNEVTASVPEVVETARALPADELILDGEVVALTPEGRPHPFQVTMRRFGRKTELDRLRAELPLTPMWFDILWLDGGSLIDHPQAERFRLLESIAPREQIVPHTIATDLEAAEAFLRDSLAAGHEGVMAKSTASLYVAGGRGQAWLKIKKSHTLDLVILAAEWGSGRRKGWLSNLHLGARDTRHGGYAMLGKTFKGMTDEMLRWQTEQLLAIETRSEGHTVFVEPKIVVEIAWSDIQISPRYESGLALRFARVKRYRTDKTAAEADTFETVQKLAGIAPV